jgi:hypothetical protein
MPKPVHIAGLRFRNNGPRKHLLLTGAQHLLCFSQIASQIGALLWYKCRHSHCASPCTRRLPLISGRRFFALHLVLRLRCRYRDGLSCFGSTICVTRCIGCHRQYGASHQKQACSQILQVETKDFFRRRQITLPEEGWITHTTPKGYPKWGNPYGLYDPILDRRG